ncbi:MAG: recombinase family protein [Solirubrobacterales bacterium]|nr:recombinase family protein [Solirubrobacterales bacterium]
MNSPESFRAGRPAKIQASHLDRWAIVYVRQSHPQQVQRHRESALVQSQLRERALHWGWPADRIRVLDGDQGCSGTTTAGRDDFAWLLAEIALGHVGLVLGFQVNRLAREDETCCRLITLCATFNTLLADQDGLYHPRDFNDRILLTVKGLTGGIELHEIQQRMQASRLSRAHRGEWMGQPPPGYVVGPDAKLQLDPDEQVRHVITLIFEQFLALGSLSGLLRHLRRHHLQMPFRPASGPDAGQLQWHAPQRETLRQILRRPAYAGAYTWGRRAVDPTRAQPGRRGTGRSERPPQECAVFLPDNHPAYISWDQYERNLHRLTQHRRHGPTPGPARTTVALLAGLVVCGQCGCRMQTHYTRSLRYACQRRALDYAEPLCLSFGGAALEHLVGEQVLQVVTPAALELSLHAAAECQRQRAALDHQWQLRLERARHEAARAFRQYNTVEPENRLVARTLERRWEETLATQRALEEEYDRFQREQPVRLSAAERARIEALARDLPAVWHAPRTAVEEKRQVVRLLLQRVVVQASASRPALLVHLHWSGGTVTEHQVPRTVRSWEQVADAAVVWQRVQDWRTEGWTSRRMAAELNAAGYRTPRGQPFTSASIRQLLARGGPRTAGTDARPARRASPRSAEGTATP